MKDVMFDKWFRKNSLNAISYSDCWNAAWDACESQQSKQKLEMPVSCKECKIRRCEADMYSSSCKINLIWDFLNRGGNNADI